jgi:hypothetical protein
MNVLLKKALIHSIHELKKSICESDVLLVREKSELTLLADVVEMVFRDYLNNLLEASIDANSKVELAFTLSKLESKLYRKIIGITVNDPGSKTLEYSQEFVKEKLDAAIAEFEK